MQKVLWSSTSWIPSEEPGSGGVVPQLGVSGRSGATDIREELGLYERAPRKLTPEERVRAMSDAELEARLDELRRQRLAGVEDRGSESTDEATA